MGLEGFTRRRHLLLSPVLAALVYWALSWGNWVLFNSAGILPMPIWPAAGLAIALVYRFGWMMVPGIMAGAFLANVVTLGASWQLAIIIAVGNGLGAWVAIRGARLFSKSQEPYFDNRDTLIFIIWSVFIHAAITATGGVSGQVLLGLLPQADYAMDWLRWWLAHAAGTVLFAPLLLSWYFAQEKTCRRNGEYFLVFAVTVALTVWVFFFKTNLPLGLPYFLILPLAWVAIRNSMNRTMLLFTLFVLISMSGVVLARTMPISRSFPLLPYTLMAVAYGLVLILLSTMKRSQERMMTQLRSKTEELAASEHKLSTLFDSMAEMVVLHELVFDEQDKPIDYRIIDCNKTYTEVTGVKKEAAVGRLGSDVYGAKPPPYMEEYTSVAINGGKKKLDTYYAPMDKHFLISIASPGPNQFATLTIDITAEKQAEETIVRINDQLQSKNKELEQVIYVASHDLRSPLVNIDGYSRELGLGMEEIHRQLNEGEACTLPVAKAITASLAEMESAQGFVRRSAAQMDILLSGLLKLSRSGRAALHIGPQDMNVLLKTVVEGVEYQIREAGAQVTIETLPACVGDRLAVSQIFANLIGNALKYLDPLRPGQIRVSGEVRDGNSVYTVEDNGIGIAKAHQKKIFEVFHRLQPDRFSGEGLGLTIVHQALDRLGGAISVDSTPDQGSRFFVTLPAVRGRTETRSRQEGL